MEIRAETFGDQRAASLEYMLRVRALSVGNEKPLAVLRKSSRVRFGMYGLDPSWRQRREEEGAVMVGVGDGAAPVRAVGEVGTGRPGTPAWRACIVSFF